MKNVKHNFSHFKFNLQTLASFRTKDEIINFFNSNGFELSDDKLKILTEKFNNTTNSKCALSQNDLKLVAGGGKGTNKSSLRKKKNTRRANNPTSLSLPLVLPAQHTVDAHILRQNPNIEESALEPVTEASANASHSINSVQSLVKEKSTISTHEPGLVRTASSNIELPAAKRAKTEQNLSTTAQEPVSPLMYLPSASPVDKQSAKNPARPLDIPPNSKSPLQTEQNDKITRIFLPSIFPEGSSPKSQSVPLVNQSKSHIEKTNVSFSQESTMQPQILPSCLRTVTPETPIESKVSAEEVNALLSLFTANNSQQDATLRYIQSMYKPIGRSPLTKEIYRRPASPSSSESTCVSHSSTPDISQDSIYTNFSTQTNQSLSSDLNQNVFCKYPEIEMPLQEQINSIFGESSKFSKIIFEKIINEISIPEVIENLEKQQIVGIKLCNVSNLIDLVDAAATQYGINFLSLKSFIIFSFKDGNECTLSDIIESV